MSSWVPTNPPEHGGKMHQPKKIRKIGQCKQHGYFESRYRQDDSGSVNMSDNRLGGGVGKSTRNPK